MADPNSAFAHDKDAEPDDMTVFGALRALIRQKTRDTERMLKRARQRQMELTILQDAEQKRLDQLRLDKSEAQQTLKSAFEKADHGAARQAAILVAKLENLEPVHIEALARVEDRLGGIANLLRIAMMRLNKLQAAPEAVQALEQAKLQDEDLAVEAQKLTQRIEADDRALDPEHLNLCAEDFAHDTISACLDASDYAHIIRTRPEDVLARLEDKPVGSMLQTGFLSRSS